MEKDKAIDLFKTEKRFATQNLYAWAFSVITLSSAILSVISIKLIESSDINLILFGKCTAGIFSMIIIIGLWILYANLKRTYLLASCGDKIAMGLDNNLDEDEKNAEKNSERYKPYRIMRFILVLFSIGIIMILVAIALITPMSETSGNDTKLQNKSNTKNYNAKN